MLEDEVLNMIVRGTRGGKKRRPRKSKSTTLKKKRTGVAKSGYIAHVKKYWKMHPNLTWKEAMVKARTSYKPKGSARAGVMAGKKYSGSKSRLSKANKKLRDTRAISKTLRALSYIPTPLSGYAADASAISSALGYGRRYRR